MKSFYSKNQTLQYASGESARRWISIIGSVLLILNTSDRPASAQGMLTITFDGEPLPPPGQRYVINQNYQESGMRFSSGGDGHGNYGIIHAGADYFENYPYNGTPYFQAHQFGYGPIFCQSDPAVHGPLFGVFSIDLAGLDAVGVDFFVIFNAVRSDGAYLKTTVSGSGLDFQTFHFDPGWSSGLSYLEISSIGYSMDNLVEEGVGPKL